ncbi:MAG: DNA-processing protein DprA [Patescibacteria group bacterium]
MRNDLPYWLALRAYEKFGPRSFERLLLKFETMEEAFHASREALLDADLTTLAVDSFLHLREDIHPEALVADLERHHLTAITKCDEEYPALLGTIYDPPPVLFIAGTLPPAEIAHVAIVGSRKASPYGLRIAAQMSEELAEAGCVIVSGLAYGIDEAAHSATLKTKGLTVAVLACGHNQLIGRARYLAQKIVEAGGAVISEFPLHTPAHSFHFPIRNRIISGMSQGTLIVEATNDSGSLITARSALEQGRDVFAIPGNIDSPTSVGTNGLLKVGAYPTTSSQDILDVLRIEKRPDATRAPITPDSADEAAILPFLSQTPVHIDDLVHASALGIATVASTLTLMEIKGRVRHVGGMFYILV